MAGGNVVVPAGSRLLGSVTLVEQGGRVKERARLGVRFHTLVLADGTEVRLPTETIYREGESPAGQERGEDRRRDHWRRDSRRHRGRRQGCGDRRRHGRGQRDRVGHGGRSPAGRASLRAVADGARVRQREHPDRAVARRYTRPMVAGVVNYTQVDASVACGGDTPRDAFVTLAEQGFRAVVNLRLDGEPGVAEEAAAVAAAGLRYCAPADDAVGPGVRDRRAVPRGRGRPIQPARLHPLRLGQSRRRRLGHQARRAGRLDAARPHSPKARPSASRVR